VVPTAQLMIHDDNVSLDDAACAFINPFTSYGLVYTAEEHGAKVLINSAANSTVGKMVIRICLLKGITTINLVRSQEKVDELKKIGAVHVLNTSDESFEQDLMEKAASLHPTVALDCVTGELSGLMLKALDNNGVVLNFGTLSGKHMSNIDADDLILRNKTLGTFVMNFWLEALPLEEKIKAAQFIKTNLATVFKPDIATKIPITTFKEGIKMYKNNMSGGKILVIP